jgi:hypothetical protein
MRRAVRADAPGRLEQPVNVFKKWTIVVLGVTLFLIGLVGAVNFVVDPHGVFHGEPSRRPQTPNLSYMKIEYLLGQKHAFDSFLLGSSRVANIDVRHIPGGRWYNLFLAAALPEEHLQHVRFLLNNGITIQNLLIGLDDFSFLFDPRDHLSELDLQPHPGVSGKNLSTFYSEYLFKAKRFVPLLNSYIRSSIRKGISSDELRYQFDMSGTGMVFCGDCDENIERDREAHVRSDVFLRPWEYRFLEGDHFEASLAALKEIVDLSRKNNIRLVLFINPIHKKTYLNAHLKDVARFKKDLALIADYYDFSGLNPVTTNNYNYYETSHYRLLVGDMMLKVMFGDPPVDVPRGFGVRVSRYTVDSHLADQCREIQDLPVQEGLSAENREYAAFCARDAGTKDRIYVNTR